ncbi:MAG: competence/damage-inducible protein A [candidate division Zixibacteria bacterium]|nr:competence/damage-inducible protein A [candidate division Zixibacteria bacterium]
MMDVEIITIGFEILSGHTVDTNAAFIGSKLTENGLDIKYVTSVGDNLEDIEMVIKQALNRSNIVITTGGLGPTDDDITKKGIVKVFKRNLIFHDDVLKEIKSRYARRNLEMPAITQNQALLPQGGKFFTNKNGTAVGICIAEKGKIFISLPGVPHEMEQILTDEVIPYLQSLKVGGFTKITTLHTIGVTESKIAEMIKPNLKLPSGVRLAYLPSYSGVDLRIHSVSDSNDDAEQKRNSVKKQLESACGKYIYGEDDDKLETVVAQLLIDNDITISVAESCTGGQLGMLITSVSGSSKYFLGGILSYDNDVKINMLGVDKEIIEKYGAVSEECAKAMAENCRKKFDTGYALSITGIAGPEGGSDDKPIGTTYLGLSSIHNTYARKFIFGKDRYTNRTRAAYSSLELLRREILDIK